MYMSFFQIWFLAISVGVLTALLNRSYYIRKIKKLSKLNQQHTNSKTCKEENISS
ncbi:Uncharacterised protein [Campylobacter jejuni]|nr:Uncharacterised protein [Campylobacter jejuni]